MKTILEFIFGKEEHCCIHTIDGTCEICGNVNAIVRYSYELRTGKRVY